MISHKLPGILPCPCMLRTPVCATSLTNWLGWMRLLIVISKGWILSYKAISFPWMLRKHIPCLFLPWRNRISPKIKLKTWIWKFATMSLQWSKDKIPWCVNRGKFFLPKENLQTLHTSTMKPQFRDYCSAWGFTGSTENNQLQKLQNRAARIMTHSSFGAPCRPPFFIQNLKIYNSTKHIYMNDTIGSMISMTTLNDRWQKQI